MDGDRVTRLLDVASIALFAFGLTLVAVWLLHESGAIAAAVDWVTRHQQATSDLARIRRMWGE